MSEGGAKKVGTMGFTGVLYEGSFYVGSEEAFMFELCRRLSAIFLACVCFSRRMSLTRMKHNRDFAAIASD